MNPLRKRREQRKERERARREAAREEFSARLRGGADKPGSGTPQAPKGEKPPRAKAKAKPGPEPKAKPEPRAKERSKRSERKRREREKPAPEAGGKPEAEEPEAVRQRPRPERRRERRRRPIFSRRKTPKPPRGRAEAEPEKREPAAEKRAPKAEREPKAAKREPAAPRREREKLPAGRKPAGKGARARRASRRRDPKRGARLAAAGKASREGVKATRRRAGGFLPRLGRGASTILGAIGRVLRPALVLILAVIAFGERAVRGTISAGGRAMAGGARRLDRVITPPRAAFGLVVASAICLIVAQFVDYRGVEIGQADYAEVSDIAAPPQRLQEKTGEAHAYALIPLALAAVAVAAVALRRRRWRLCRLVALAGLAGIAVTLLIDMPRGLDEAEGAVVYEGAKAVLTEGFYAQLAACAGLMLGGLLLSFHIRPPGKPAPARRQRRSRRRRPKKGRKTTPPVAEAGT